MLRPTESTLRAGPSGLLLAVEAALVGQSFWLVGLMLAEGGPDRDFGLGSGLIIPLAAIVFFFLKKSALNNGGQEFATFRNSFRASLQGTVAVAVILTTILSPVAPTPGTVVASGALGLAFAVATTILFDWMSARQLPRVRAEAPRRRARRIAFLGDDRACRSLAKRLDKIEDAAHES